MALPSPSEYDARYFDGRSFPDGGHPAGYSDYNRRHQRTDLNWPGGSLGELYLDIAARWINERNLQNKKILELGCATGLILRSALDLGVSADSRGVDVSQWAYDNADPAVQPYIIVGDAREDLTKPPFNFRRNFFDVAVSRAFLGCFVPSEIQALIDNMATVSRRMFHEIDELANPSYYTAQPLSWWQTTFSWPAKTVLRSAETGEEVIA